MLNDAGTLNAVVWLQASTGATAVSLTVGLFKNLQNRADGIRLCYIPLPPVRNEFSGTSHWSGHRHCHAVWRPWSWKANTSIVAAATAAGKLNTCFFFRLVRWNREASCLSWLACLVVFNWSLLCCRSTSCFRPTLVWIHRPSSLCSSPVCSLSHFLFHNERILLADTHFNIYKHPGLHSIWITPHIAASQEGRSCLFSSSPLFQSAWPTHDNAEAANQPGQCWTQALCVWPRRPAESHAGTNRPQSTRLHSCCVTSRLNVFFLFLHRKVEELNEFTRFESLQQLN